MNAAISAAILVAFAGGIVFGILLAVSHPIYGALRDSRAAKRRISDEAIALLQRVAPQPANCAREPPYSGWPTALLAIDGLTAHPPTDRCAIANPHPIDACGEWEGGAR